MSSLGVSALAVSHRMASDTFVVLLSGAAEGE